MRMLTLKEYLVSVPSKTLFFETSFNCTPDMISSKTLLYRGKRKVSRKREFMSRLETDLLKAIDVRKGDRQIMSEGPTKASRHKS